VAFSVGQRQDHKLSQPIYNPLSISQAQESQSTAHYLSCVGRAKVKGRDRHEQVEKGMLQKRTRRRGSLLCRRILDEFYALLDVTLKAFGTSLEQFLLMVIEMR